MPANLNLSQQNIWLLAAGAAALIVILALCARLILRGPRSSAPPRSASIGLAEQRSLERDINSLMNELADMSSQIGRQLDARATRLEQLIRAADERIEQLNSTPAPAPAPRAAAPAPTIDDSGPDPRDLEIYRLYDQGLAPRDIAQRLARPAGEVELILALRPRRSDVA